MITVHIKNMENVGLDKKEYENPEYLAEYLVSLWENSGKGRKAGVVVCVSKEGLYHAHMACYGNTTTLKKVSEILGNAHVEPQMGGKKALKGYLLKEGKNESKGEQVLCQYGLEAIQDVQGKRNDLDEIEELLENGATPKEIFELSIHYRRYEKIIKSEYIAKRLKKEPLKKSTYNEWHIGESGSGKSDYYYELCEKYTSDNVYLLTDQKNGGFDLYIEQGLPPILFIDDLESDLFTYNQLLTILGKFSRAQTHCRYGNTYNLWTTCVITSSYGPEEIYDFLVDDYRKGRDKIDQLLRRLDIIVYHYVQNGEFKRYSIPANEYKNIEDLKRRALEENEGFYPVENEARNPFVKE